MSAAVFARPGAAPSCERRHAITVGVLVPGFGDPLVGRTLRGIEQGLSAWGGMAVVASSEADGRLAAQRLELLVRGGVDGLIVMDCAVPEPVLRDFAQRRPLVVVGREMQAPGLSACAIDHAWAAELAARHLLALGHRRVAQVAGSACPVVAQQWRQGHAEALSAFGERWDDTLAVWTEPTEAGGLAAMERLLDGGGDFSAVVLAGSRTAHGACRALARRDLRVPDDFSLVGIVEGRPEPPAAPDFTEVPLPCFELGLHATQAFLRLLGQVVRLEPVPALRLAVRESTLPPRITMERSVS